MDLGEAMVGGLQGRPVGSEDQASGWIVVRVDDGTSLDLATTVSADDENRREIEDLLALVARIHTLEAARLGHTVRLDEVGLVGRAAANASGPDATHPRGRVLPFSRSRAGRYADAKVSPGTA